jgi:hypothetical protein
MSIVSDADTPEVMVMEPFCEAELVFRVEILIENRRAFEAEQTSS